MVLTVGLEDTDYIILIGTESGRGLSLRPIVTINLKESGYIMDKVIDGDNISYALRKL